jgi:hypothetical protein
MLGKIMSFFLDTPDWVYIVLYVVALAINIGAGGAVIWAVYQGWREKRDSPDE